MCTVNMDSAALPDRWAISSGATHSWQIWEICCRLNGMSLRTSPITSGIFAPVWYSSPVFFFFFFSYIENICISEIIGKKSTWKCIKGSVMISQMCSNRSACVWITCCITSGYSTATVWVQQEISALFSHSRSVDVHSPSAENTFVFCLAVQEHESATGPGRELRAGPDLHHREDHFCVLPQQRGRAELCSQPAGGCFHAALQTRPKLPGMLFPNESIGNKM